MSRRLKLGEPLAQRRVAAQLLTVPEAAVEMSALVFEMIVP
jgi:hypothetical protein